MERREVFKTLGATAAGLVAGSVPPANADAGPTAAQLRNPYGGGPNTGITLPPYYRPTPSVRNANTFFPGVEELGKDEMRISFVGSSPVPPTRSQAGTAIMVELGSGKRFFFDVGPGCLRNIVALQVPLALVNDIFITHLHVDHYAELPYIYAFSPWVGRWKPLRVHGPSGRTPKDGIKSMIEGMKQMMHWHTDSFQCFPMGDGYEIEVNEFDYTDDNGICYDKDGVVIRHWRRAHGKDGASAYRLDWNGLSFVWTGDGRPEANTARFSKGVDVFVTELQPDTMNVQALKFGIPPIVGTTTVDAAHTVHYATGYMFQQVQPRLAMATHLSYDEEFVPEMVAGIRTHYDGLFQFGAPDGVVVNVTKKAIWTRKAALADSTNFARPSTKEAMELFGLSLTKTTIDFPNPTHAYMDIEGPAPRDQEYDARLYYPPDVYRKPNGVWPANFQIDLKKMAGEKIEAKLEEMKEGAGNSRGTAGQDRAPAKAAQEQTGRQITTAQDLIAWALATARPLKPSR